MKKRLLSGVIILTMLLPLSVGIEVEATNINKSETLSLLESIDNQNIYLEKSISDESVDETYEGSFKTENGCINYNIENNEIIIEKYIGEDTELYIPNEIDGKFVTTIKKYAFPTNVNLRTIYIPSSINKIEDDAFFWCDKLNRIYVDENNKNYSDENGVLFNKDKSVLVYCPFGNIYKEYKVPDTVTTIGNGAFRNRTGLEKIEIPNTVTKIGDNSFNYCIQLKSINIPSSVIEIGDFAFNLCSCLEKIEIPNSVIKIGNNAFSCCSKLVEINIPASVLSIGDAAFSQCMKLTRINVDENNKNYIDEDGILFNKTMSKLLTYPVRKKEETYKIPNLVTSIENSAFNTCTYLKSIEIPNSVTDIGDLAFESCISLTNINIPNSVIEIGDSAFNNCRELKKIEIPNSVVKIGKCGFSLCKNLTEIKMSNSLTSIEYGTFAYCKNLKEIIISESITNIGIGAFYECSNLESINIPNSVTNIDEEAFFNCDKLTINGYKDSYAETYAKEHSIPFKEIQELEIITSINNFTADKKSPQISGTVIKLSVEAAGKGTLQYKFIIKDNKTGNWAKLRDYGTNNTYIWKTKATGDKTLYVDVKDEKGQVIRKSLGYTVQEKVSAPVIKSFVSDKKSPQISGESIKLSVEAIGTGILQYKFIIKDNKTGNWYKLRDYNTSNVYLWTTKQTGNKTLYVDVKDSNGQVTRKSMNYIVK